MSEPGLISRSRLMTCISSVEEPSAEVWRRPPYLRKKPYVAPDSLLQELGHSVQVHKPILFGPMHAIALAEREASKRYGLNTPELRSWRRTPLVVHSALVDLTIAKFPSDVGHHDRASGGAPLLATYAEALSAGDVDGICLFDTDLILGKPCADALTWVALTAKPRDYTNPPPPA